MTDSARPSEGSTSQVSAARQAKIEKAMRCSLCHHDWFAHDFDHPTPDGCPCRDCEGGVCLGPK